PPRRRGPRTSTALPGRAPTGARRGGRPQRAPALLTRTTTARVHSPPAGAATPRSPACAPAVAPRGRRPPRPSQPAVRSCRSRSSARYHRDALVPPACWYAACLSASVFRARTSRPREQRENWGKRRCPVEGTTVAWEGAAPSAPCAFDVLVGGGLDPEPL